MSELDSLAGNALLASITRMALRVLSVKLSTPTLRVAAIGDLSPLSRVAEILTSDSQFPVQLKYFGAESSQYVKSYAEFSPQAFDCVLVIAEDLNAENRLLGQVGLADKTSPQIVRWQKYLRGALGALQIPGPLPTCLNYEKLFALSAALFFAPSSGPVLECGVFQGGTTVFLARLQRELGLSREILAFDTFQGLPAPVKQDFEVPGETYPAGFFGETSLDGVLKLYEQHTVRQDIRVCQGLVGDTLPLALQGKACSFALLDMDQYMGTHQALEIILRNCQSGTLIIVDDTSISGVNRAIEEACAIRPLVRRLITGNFDLLAIT